MAADGPAQAPQRRSRVFLAVAGTLAVFFFVVFVALGTWQLKRRVWKLDLIARVEQRVHAPPVAVPGPAEWPHISAATHEYLHVTASGTFVDGSQTLVQAVTDLGSGYWVLTPLRMADDSLVLVNRGFVLAEDRGRVAPAMGPGGGAPVVTPARADHAAAAIVAPARADHAAAAIVASVRPSGDATRAGADALPVAHVTGLLRMTEPRGAFLRHNDPTTDHWYSRDVQAIAAARDLKHVAPYFIDADRTPSAAGPGHTTAVTPVGGLTVITFHNSHLVYAITWYTLAAMVGIAIRLGIRNEART
jgi:surfeit locus 1 family protein